MCFSVFKFNTNDLKYVLYTQENATSGLASFQMNSQMIQISTYRYLYLYFFPNLLLYYECAIDVNILQLAGAVTAKAAVDGMACSLAKRYSPCLTSTNTTALGHYIVGYFILKAAYWFFVLFSSTLLLFYHAPLTQYILSERSLDEEYINQHKSTLHQGVRYLR